MPAPARRSLLTPVSLAQCRLAPCACSLVGDDGETLLADGLGDPNHDSDIGRIVYAFRQWRGEPAPAWWDEAEHGEWVYRDIPGFCKAETIEGIKKQRLRAHAGSLRRCGGAGG